jgi:hypothetical protein
MSEERSGIKVTASDALEFEPVAPKLKKAGSVLKTVLFVVLAVGGGATGWAFYGDRIVSMMGDAESDVPIVRAELGPVKVRPASPGGLQVPDRDKLVYNRIQGGDAQNATPSVERLLPPPETPLPKPVAAKPVESSASSQSSVTITQSTGQSASGSGTAGGIPLPPSKPKRINETPRVADVAHAEKPIPAPPAPPAPVTTKVAKIAPNPTPAPTSAPAPVTTRKVTSSTAKLVTSGSSPTQPLSNKTYKVQLAAARTPAAARGEWDKLRSKHLDVLGDMGLSVTKVDLGATKGVFYRLRVGPLKGEKEARALCKSLARRKVSCLIVRPGK